MTPWYALGGERGWGTLADPRTVKAPGGRVRPPHPRIQFGLLDQGGEGHPPPLPSLPRTQITQPGRVPRYPPLPYHGCMFMPIEGRMTVCRRERLATVVGLDPFREAIITLDPFREAIIRHAPHLLRST